MKLNIIVIVILGFSILFVTNQAYAPCIEGPGNNCNNYPPPGLTQISTDKLNYETTDKPIVTIMGAPDAIAHLEIDDSSSNIIFTHDINLAPNGTVGYVLDISSYKPGVYSVIVTSPISKLTTSFSVGLTPTGGRIVIQSDRNSYLPGDNVVIVGTWNSNTLIQLSLIDPSGISVKSSQTFSDKTGHFSSPDLVIPMDAISGIWQIGADSGMTHTRIQISINSTVYNHSKIKLDETAVLSPLKQFRSGVTTQNIACNEEFVLAIKKHGHQPACVNPDTIPKLVLRGWSENPLDNLLLKYGNHTQANLVFYDIMNEQKIRDWSMKGWRYSDYSYTSNGETSQYSATIHLYLPSNIGQHECENGSYGIVVINLKPIEIEHNYTEVGCGIVTTTAKLDPQSNGMYGTLSGIVSLAGGPANLSGPKSNYEVDVYTADGTTVVGKTFSDANAHYSIQLPAGNYTVYVPDYPDKQTHFISVFPGKNTTFNIAYGTGYK